MNEIIRPGENGLLAPEMTPESLAHSLSRLMGDQALRVKMGREGKAAAAGYAPAKVYDLWEELLGAAMQRERSRLEEAASSGSSADANLQPLRELLGRKHPFDRSAYLRMHTETGGQSPFTDEQIAGFIKKHKKFGLPAPHRPLAVARRFFRRIRP